VSSARSGDTIPQTPESTTAIQPVSHRQPLAGDRTARKLVAKQDVATRTLLESERDHYVKILIRGRQDETDLPVVGLCCQQPLTGKGNHGDVLLPVRIHSDLDHPHRCTIVYRTPNDTGRSGNILHPHSPDRARSWNSHPDNGRWQTFVDRSSACHALQYGTRIHHTVNGGQNHLPMLLM
jgi:hypothetical protein